MQSLRIVFAGTPEFAVPSLRALLNSPHRILCVYTQPDRPAGRGRKLTPSPIKDLALAQGIEVRQPLSLKGEAEVAALAALQPDLMVVVAYGLLLPRGILEVPRLGCINVHASLLPRWRGAAPIQRAIEAGDRETGVTIMQMEAGLDTGPMYLAKAIPIGAEDTGGLLHDRLAELGASALQDALPGIAQGTLRPRPQDDALATYASKLSKDEALIDWTRPAADLARKVRAFNPWPVAQTRWGDGVLRIWGARALAGGDTVSADQVLTASKSGIDVKTGDGILRITELQAPGKRPMTTAEFVNAHKVEGAAFG